MSERPPLQTALAVGLVAGSTLALQVLRREDAGERPPERALSRVAALYAALLLVTPTLLVRLDYSFDRFEVDLHFSVNLALAALLAAACYAAAAAHAAFGRWPEQQRPATRSRKTEATSAVG